MIFSVTLPLIIIIIIILIAFIAHFNIKNYDKMRKTLGKD